MKKFVDQHMPHFIEKITSRTSFENFQNKAQRNNGLPQAIFFTSKAKTVALTKYLSIEFRRRLLIGEVYPTKPNQDIMKHYSISSLPALIIILNTTHNNGDDAEEEVIKYEGDGFTKNKLHSFLNKYALKEKVFKKKNEHEESKEQTKTKVNGHGEL